MTTTILDLESGVTGGNATVKYSGILSDLAENDTIGITVEADVNLHTVPSGGQTLYEALTALAVLVVADGYGAVVAKNSAYDQCLHVQGLAGASVTLSAPVYAVA